MDAGIGVPGTSIRFGLDPIIGLIPGFGDAAGALLSLWILVEAARQGIPRATLVRMACNIGVDALVGAVPFLGDLFDVAWKANMRNVDLIERRAGGDARARNADRLFVFGLGAAVLLVLGGLAVGGWYLTARIFQALR